MKFNLPPWVLRSLPNDATVPLAYSVNHRWASRIRLAGTILPYPIKVEAIRQVGDLYSHNRLNPLMQKLFARLMA